MKLKIVVGLIGMTVASLAVAQSMQFCVYNKYGQKQGGCYLDKKACENVVASYNKSNASMGLFCKAG
jgi:lactate dehydrogenase-like 2-hydroxyacid dehydrogenase